ncbi:hypothetical protein BD770DRAFT_395056 [Pilaira anomala]|nr:hypothetical protein BD770DRAFT_395056 [Pilaira anomala]
MTTVASSSSKSRFPSFSHRVKFDDLISEIPYFYDASTHIDPAAPAATTFKTTASYHDPELYMGDDCDTSYEMMLMNSEFMMNKDIDGFSKTTTNQDLNIHLFHSPENHKKAHQRLEMLLAHVNSTFSNSNNEKGKGKMN